MSVSLFVQYALPHFTQTVLRNEPLSSGLTGAKAVNLLGKLVAFLWQTGSHAVQPFRHLWG
jgi:hypothetical protein